jgi:hypothetical protein
MRMQHDRSGAIKGFVAPVSGKLVVLDWGYFTTMGVLDLARESTAPCFPLSAVTYKGQSMTTVAINLMDHLVGSYPKSRLGPHLRELFRIQKGGVCAQHWLAVDKRKDVALDINKAYTQCLANPSDPWCVYGPLDQPSPIKADIQTDFSQGFYLVKPDSIHFTFAPLYVCVRRLLPACFIRFALEEGALQLADITHSLLPDRVLPPSLFTSAVEQLETLFYSDASIAAGCKGQAKQLINRYIGSLGIYCTKETRSTMTDDLEYVSMLHGRCLKVGETPVVVRTTGQDDLFFVKTSKDTSVDEMCLPMHQQIIWQSNVSLLRMCKAGHAAGMTALGTQTARPSTATRTSRSRSASTLAWNAVSYLSRSARTLAPRV